MEGAIRMYSFDGPRGTGQRQTFFSRRFPRDGVCPDRGVTMPIFFLLHVLLCIVVGFLGINRNSALGYFFASFALTRLSA